MTAAALLLAATTATCAPWEPESAGQTSYLRRVTLSINQTVNTIFGGQPDETVSSRVGRNRGNSRAARAACWVFDKIDPCHCEVAAEVDEHGQPRPHQFYIVPRLPLRRVPYIRPNV